MARIGPESHVTLHYRLALVAADEEREVISTLAARPATFQIGGGQVAPALEGRLIGLAEGEVASFDLAPDEAFGRRVPELVRTLGCGAFEGGAGSAGEHAPGDVVELRAPWGARFAGLVRSVDESKAVVDFNHPLAGMRLRFSVQVIGVL